MCLDDGAAESMIDVAEANPDEEGYKEMIARQIGARPEEKAFEPAYTPWYLGQLEQWMDAENFFRAPDPSKPNTPYLIFMGCCMAAVASAAIIMGR